VIKLGLKLWSNNADYQRAARELYNKKTFQYIELLVKPGTLDFLPQWKNTGIPFALHAPHTYAGMNLARKSARGTNRMAMKDLDKYTQALGALYVVFHGGLDGEIGETIDQLNSFSKEFPCVFKNALIENKPNIGLKGEKCVGSSVEEIRDIMRNTGMGFCLDFGHAMCHAAFLKKDAGKTIEDFIALSPKAFHLSDGLKASIQDQHLHFGKGDYELAEMIGHVPDKAYVLIETDKEPKDGLGDFAGDVLFVNKLVGKWTGIDQ
jgi:endonuclease IV